MTKPAIKQRVVSIDVPWSGAHYIGVAVADIDDNGKVKVTVHTTKAQILKGEMPPPFPFPADDPEISGFIQNGVGPGRNRHADIQGPFVNNRQDNLQRCMYLKQLWYGIHRIISEIPPINAPTLVAVDVPLAPANLIEILPIPNKSSQYRPVEQAFGNKVFIPGNKPNLQDHRIQFARFQAGILNGCRPGYALCRMAEIIFGARATFESFPQLVIGALCEFGKNIKMHLPSRLAAHKRGNQMAQSQQILWNLVAKWLGDEPVWGNEQAPAVARADGIDALLGLLPVLAYSGYIRQSPAGTWYQHVLLRNLLPGVADFPNTQGPGQPAIGCMPWKGIADANLEGIVDSGILTLDLSLWQ